MARPRFEIDWVVFDELCDIQCTQEEIAQVIGCSVDTIQRAVKRDKGVGFAEYYKKASAGGKTSLRRFQWAAAKGGSVPMMIWLGKQYLGQSDKVESKIDQPGTDNKITIKFVDA
jgi:hypothetical protein